ncbi:sigma 54-interacting transcriptional regulator [Fonticella tunisiensis]|uniref:Sigma 54 modulation protein n=1 Tax=Fonticella tunisiensis TaxID=1096341 RepID=A0A4R7KAY2_9CLOT|nr:sigma-54-dependent transcriptional regulator [Fonticella tunisiensis]TDT51072.1 sigma 54 modulation protein [Fonticella tunisiensis]
MRGNKEHILELIAETSREGKKGLSAGEIAQRLNMQRSNVSSILNELYRQGLVLKIKGKPVIYTTYPSKKIRDQSVKENANFDMLIGSDKSLKKCIQQAKAAILYPPNGLHTLILGPSGVGKTMFAELMYKFAVENGIFEMDAPFIAFNCADYANNPQLLMSHLFGSKKGAFTGADKDREGIVAKADGGVLFLDEVHRLPPEGQEMLFYLMDKGMYTPLGDENKKKSKVLIICATTEDIDNVLLTTFTRRIPMSIKIPSLNERTLSERFELICEFFKIEAARIGKEISVSANTIRQLLLYNCPGNVGQLKSDIQLGCANAFLNSISKRTKNIEVHCTDFAHHVNQGLLLYKNYAQEVDKFINQDVKLCFTPKGQRNSIREGDYSLPDNFYEEIEKRMQELYSRGIGENEVKMLMEFDIENHFKRFIRNFEQGIRKEELSKVVDEDIIDIVENFLKVAGKKLQKIFPTKVFYGLSLHVSSSIKRLKESKNIVNYNLSNIMEKNKKEFEVARELALALEKRYKISIPDDDIGFMAMFLAVDDTEMQRMENRPIIVIAMHGRSTASSMAEVVNKLVGANNVYAYDMSLDKSSQVAYEELKELIVKKHQGAGVMLLVDMGSLGVFGELISKETEIDIKVVNMVSTPVAIECSRKAVIDTDINKIYDDISSAISQYTPYNSEKILQSYRTNSDNVIITLCTTGEGSAVKLKNYIESRLNINRYGMQVLPMSLNNNEFTYNIINNLSKKKNIVAIVGTIDPKIPGIPYISTSEVFSGNNCGKLGFIIDKLYKTEYEDEKHDDYNIFLETLKSEISNIDLSNFEKLYREFLVRLEQKINKNIEYGISIGLMMHMGCAISSMVEGKQTAACYSKNLLKEKYNFEFKCIKESLADIENFYNIDFSDDEVCFIIQNIMGI